MNRIITFGSRIRELGEKIGKEEQQIAKDLNLTKSQLSHYINGRRKVPSELLQKIVDMYNINPQFLFKEDAPLYEDKIVRFPVKETEYPLYPKVSAGLPIEVDGITEGEVETISIPDYLMGKWAGNSDIYFTRTNGDSMNRIIPHDSLIAVKPVELHELKDNDIVVYRNHGEYAVKRFIKHDDKLVFRPDSTDNSFTDDVVHLENADDLMITGKVVVWIVTAD